MNIFDTKTKELNLKHTLGEQLAFLMKTDTKFLILFQNCETYIKMIYHIGGKEYKIEMTTEKFYNLTLQQLDEIRLAIVLANEEHDTLTYKLKNLGGDLKQKIKSI